MYRKPKPNAETCAPADEGVQIAGDGKDDGRRAEVLTKVDDDDEDSGRGPASVAAPAAVTSAARDDGPAAHDIGPTIVAVIRDDDLAAGKHVESQQPRWTATVDDHGGSPVAVTTATKGSAAADKTAVGRTTSTEGGKSSKTVGGGGGRAIVEILDRVDTPPRPPSVAVAGDDEDGGGRIDDGGAGYVPVAFSVLPNRGRDDAALPCDCPDCVKKPKTKRSSSSKSPFAALSLVCFVL